ncbi:hypothetical protein M8J77_008125 [Diaphorina citri]|nr:hypothetical protein M8J77_008125 [Diaphorina citri]
MNCNHCKNELPEEGDEARCSMCKHGYHFECTTISESSWKTLTKAKKLDWKCHVCRNSLKLPLTTRSGATSSPSQETQRDPTMIAMQKLWKADFAKFTATLGEKLDEYEKSLEFTAGKMDDIAKDIKVIQQKMIETEQKQNKIEAENKELKTRVRNLEVELKEMGQAALNNKLEISGLPNSANLNVTDVAKKFVEKTGLDPIAVGNYTVEKPFKTQNQDRPNVKASIVVGFKSVETRNQVFGKIRADKIRFKTKDIVPGTSDESSVFVNEYLSPYYRKLFYEAKKIKTEKNYAYLWVRDGKILLKKTQESNVMRLTCMDDLAKI